MKSRISIDVDQANTPVITIDYSKSEDLRDKFVGKFVEGMGYHSNWVHIIGDHQGNNPYEFKKVYELRVITSEELRYEATKMLEAADLFDGIVNGKPIE